MSEDLSSMSDRSPPASADGIMMGYTGEGLRLVVGFFVVPRGRHS
jgi:hypothetical protein